MVSPSTPSRSPGRRRVEAPAAALGVREARQLVRRASLLWLALVGAESVALLLIAASSGAASRAVPFLAPLLVGEAAACALQLVDRPRAATVLSLSLAAATAVALTFLFDAALAVSPWALFVGAACALVQLACARIADDAVALRRGPTQWVVAALDHMTFVPASIVLALLGRSEQEDTP